MVRAFPLIYRRKTSAIYSVVESMFKKKSKLYPITLQSPGHEHLSHTFVSFKHCCSVVIVVGGGSGVVVVGGSTGTQYLS